MNKNRSITTKYLLYAVIILFFHVSYSESTTKTIIDNKNYFKITIDNEFKVKHIPNSRDLIKLTADWKKDSGFQIRKYINTKKSLKNFSRWFIDNFEKEMGGTRGIINLKSCTNEKISDYQCFVIIHSYTVRSQQWILYNYLFKNRMDIINIQGGVVKNLEPEYRKKLNKICNSIELL